MSLVRRSGLVVLTLFLVAVFSAFRVVRRQLASLFQGGGVGMQDASEGVQKKKKKKKNCFC